MVCVPPDICTRPAMLVSPRHKRRQFRASDPTLRMKRLPDKPRQSRAGVSFHRSAWAVSPVPFAAWHVQLCRDDVPVRFPEVRITVTCPIKLRDVTPEFPAGRFAPVADYLGDHLSGVAAAARSISTASGSFSARTDRICRVRVRSPEASSCSSAPKPSS